jgi:hypothetical protein
MADSDRPDKRLKDIGLILRDLLKVIKVVSMYPADNPLPESMRRSFADRLVGLIEEYGRFTVSVEKETLSLANEVIFQDKSKEETLAGLFFQAGITDFTFKEELDFEDIYLLLDAIKEHINLPQHSQDLASRLWELGINGFSFSTLEDMSLSEYDEGFNVREYLESTRSRRSAGPAVPGDLRGAYESIFSFPGEAQQGEPDARSETDGGHDAEDAREEQAGRAAFYGFDGSEGSGTVLDNQSIDSASQRTADAARAMGLDDLAPGKPLPPDTTLILNEELRLSAEEKTETDRLVNDDARFDTHESAVEISASVRRS